MGASTGGALQKQRQQQQLEEIEERLLLVEKSPNRQPYNSSSSSSNSKSSSSSTKDDLTLAVAILLFLIGYCGQPILVGSISPLLLLLLLLLLLVLVLETMCLLLSPVGLRWTSVDSRALRVWVLSSFRCCLLLLLLLLIAAAPPVATAVGVYIQASTFVFLLPHFVGMVLAGCLPISADSITPKARAQLRKYHAAAAAAAAAPIAAVAGGTIADR